MLLSARRALSYNLTAIQHISSFCKRSLLMLRLLCRFDLCQHMHLPLLLQDAVEFRPRLVQKTSDCLKRIIFRHHRDLGFKVPFEAPDSLIFVLAFAVSSYCCNCPLVPGLQRFGSPGTRR